MSSSKPNVYVAINDLEIGALLVQTLLFSPSMAPLAHIHTCADNTAAQVWDNIGSVSTSSSFGPILQEISLAARRQHIHA